MMYPFVRSSPVQCGDCGLHMSIVTKRSDMKRTLTWTCTTCQKSWEIPVHTLNDAQPVPYDDGQWP